MLKAVISLNTTNISYQTNGNFFGTVSGNTFIYGGKKKKCYLNTLATCNLRKCTSHHTDHNHTERHSVKLEGWITLWAACLTPGLLMPSGWLLPTGPRRVAWLTGTPGWDFPNPLLLQTGCSSPPSAWAQWSSWGGYHSGGCSKPPCRCSHHPLPLGSPKIPCPGQGRSCKPCRESKPWSKSTRDIKSH